MFVTMMATMALSGVAMAAWHLGWLAPFLVLESLAVGIAYVFVRRTIAAAGWKEID
ncbi:MAG: hypothetical protein U0992_16385 [Planctomycetaceae bacterium]